MPMLNPSHPGQTLRADLAAAGWSVSECARRLGVTRGTLSRLLRGEIGLSPRMALALEDIGWSNAEHWMRLQANYELARERLARERRQGDSPASRLGAR